MSDKALLCGINQYKTISRLRGCVNDVRNMERLLKERFQFQEVKTLEDHEVTAENIKRQWRWLLKGAKTGDRLIFHFSGHGSYIDDENADEQGDGVDELLCLYDMDWDDHESFLLDDDLNQLTRRVPSGALLTVVLDCCHSGTGTKAIAPPGNLRAASIFDASAFAQVDVKTSLARMGKHTESRSINVARVGEMADEILNPDSLEDARTTVLARFVEPPPHIQETLRRAGVRRSIGRSRAEDGRLDHVLLAGSQSDQTSADAFIADDYHGAFTYHFCKTIRTAKGEIDHQDLIDKVRARLKKDQFSQIPQLEPEETSGPLLKYTLPHEDHEEDVEETETDETDLDDPDIIDDDSYIEPTIPKSDELLAGIASLLEERGWRVSPPRAQAPAAGRRALVYVHGICEHKENFSEDWWRAMRPYLSSRLRRELGDHRHEVLWSDIVTPARARTARDISPADLLEQQRLARECRLILEDRAAQQAVDETELDERGVVPARTAIAANRALLGIPGLDCVDDFMKYLVSEESRRDVLDRFRNVVVPLLREGFTIDIISHSWGTVVAYEGLWSMISDEALPGRVANLFTVGSALSLGPIKQRIRPAAGGRPPVVRRWVNLDARGDVVGGPLRGRPFQVDREHLGLAPTGCPAFAGIVSPACAHGSYFNMENRTVNREIFARYIENRD